MLRMMGSWDSVYRSQMDSVGWHWACNPQMVTLKELKSCCYIYSTGPVLRTGLSQTVTKELVTNELIFNPCESHSQDQDSPVPELSATTIANRTVLYKPAILVRILFMGPSSPVTWTVNQQSRTFNKPLTHQSTIVNLFPSWLKAPSQGPDLWEEVHYIKTQHNEKYTKTTIHIYINVKHPKRTSLVEGLENRLLKLRLRSSYKLVEGHPLATSGAMTSCGARLPYFEAI